MNPRTAPAIDWLGFLLLTACCAVVLVLRVVAWDLPQYDGAYYFQQARHWPGGGPLLREWSPVYVAVYALFQKYIFVGGPWLVYAIHRAVLLYAGIVLFWRIAARLYSPTTALVLALALLGNEGYLGNFQVVHAASLVFVLVVLRVALEWRGWAAAVVVLSVAGPGIRPEFLLAAVFVVAAAAYAWASGRTPPPARPALAVAVGLLLLFAGFWFLSTRTGADRAFDAFSQQSTWAYNESLGDKGVGGHFDHRERTRSVYGPVDSIPGAAMANPLEFARHLGRTLAVLPAALFWAVAPGAGPVFATIFLLLVCAAAALGGRREHPGGFFWLVAASFAGNVIATGIVFRPSVWYLLPVSPPFLLGLAQVAAACSGRFRRALPALPRKAAGPILAAIAIVTLLAAHAAQAPAKGRPVAQISEILGRDFHAPSPLRIHAFSAYSFHVYLAAQSVPCIPFDPDPSYRGSLGGFVEANRIDVVILSERLREFYARQEPASGADPASELARMGFRRVVSVPGEFQDETLYVKE